jgi:hypothetical protein
MLFDAHARSFQALEASPGAAFTTTCVGNERVHAAKPVLKIPHEKLTPRWLYSRAVNGSPDFIAVWRRER